ncbi:unnamed protein product [Phaedon cochleariae]|uniref:HTH psq-type domain-containing protein n=1 Tax=Phaedon cochleariae TaxID=80249 RepID=A0A9P0DRS1_PHACE|nr:unnamed protein product [Phaedon cochleariae]
MADCSYARCVQQRRNIRRELQRWTKNMVHIVGLERIAEELMGRRKWKLYQESMSRSYLQPLNNNIKRTNIPENDLDHKETKQNQQNREEAPISGIREEAREGKGETEEEYQKENEKSRASPEERLKDWQPEITKCYFCVDGKLDTLDSDQNNHGVLSPRFSDSDTSDSQSDSEVPSSLTPTSKGLLNNNHHHHHRPNVMTTIENVSMAALAVAALSGGAASPVGAPTPHHLPFYGPGVLAPNWYLASVARSFQNASAAANDVDKGGGGGGGVEQPLDLSKGGNSNGTELKVPVGNSVRLPTLDTKHIFNSDFRAKPRMSAVAGRRTYTEDELQAALRDIQSGKLGTRRAAVIYGIPRSTLRNKVYKLALERERESHLNSSTPLRLDEEEAMEEEKELSGAEEEKEVERALQAPLLSMADIFRFAGRDQAPPDALKTLLQKSKEGQDAWTGMDHSEVGPYIQNLILASQNMLASQKPPEAAVINHMIPELMKRMMAEEQLLKLQNNNGDSDRLSRPSPSNSVIMKVERPKSESDMETDDSPSNVILKIPSFKPMSSKNGCDVFRPQGESTGSMISPPVTSESSSPPILPPACKPAPLVARDVKDAIAQSIGQKFQEARRPPVLEMGDFGRGGFTPPLGMVKVQQDVGRHYAQAQRTPQGLSGGGGGTGSGSGTSTGGKGTRPKRGKYRNYDRDSLVEAVRAVQRGEMSVHRAGSYYGVPHSTLEYKVKERHLMRPRKRDPKPNPVDEKIASLKQNDLRLAGDKMKPMMKPPQKFPPTSPNGMKLPMFEPAMTPLGYNAPPFPFWPPHGFPHVPLDFAAAAAAAGRNPTTPPFAPPVPPPTHADFFASQMMQKLQEESARAVGGKSNAGGTPALAKNARQMAESLLEGPGATSGSFLDGIIRSSLESGVPPSGAKSPEEEKNVSPEHMSNKALLDQLCRNSRLTPLSKPAEGNSSGDESCRRGSSPLNFSTSGNSQHEDNNDDDSSSRYDKDGSDVHTIELSNDSTASSVERKTNDDEVVQKPRIYLKQDLVKPENLKPEMLVRFQNIAPDRNGLSLNESSASENDGGQD